jgi:DNA-3-methyladenine glycosylase I
MQRCTWATTPLSIPYHDQEWGVPRHSDAVLFEFLILEGAQAGLSWETILKKRPAYQQAMAGFDPRIIAGYGEEQITALMANSDIIRNRLKLVSAVQNARAFLEVQAAFGSFDAYLWQFVDGKPLQNVWHTLLEIPSSSPVSEALSKDLKRRGFTFVGPTICYAFMQAVGLVNDHEISCFRYVELRENL